MERRPRTPPLRQQLAMLQQQEVVPAEPRRPRLFDDPENDEVFEAALDDIVLHQLGRPMIPQRPVLPAGAQNVISPEVSDEEDPQEQVRRFERQMGDFLNAQNMRRDARIVLNQVRARAIELRREERQQALQQGLLPAAPAPARAPAVEINNNGGFRNFNGILSPSPSPSPSASPVPMDEDEGVNQDPAEQARPDDDEIVLLNAQMFGMRPHLSRPRKRHNSQGPEASKRKKVTFKEKADSDDEAINSLDDDLPDFTNRDQLNRKGYDDDDEGFFGGPPARHNSFST